MSREIAVNQWAALQGRHRVCRCDAATPGLQVSSGTLSGNTLTFDNVPAHSATLLVLPAPSAPLHILVADGFE